MEIKHDVLAAIGNTPLIRLRRASEATGCMADSARSNCAISRRFLEPAKISAATKGCT